MFFRVQIASACLDKHAATFPSLSSCSEAPNEIIANSKYIWTKE